MERTKNLQTVLPFETYHVQPNDNYPWSPGRRYVGVQCQDDRGHDIPYAVIVNSAIPWRLTPIQVQGKAQLCHLSLQSYPDEDPVYLGYASLKHSSSIVPVPSTPVIGRLKLDAEKWVLVSRGSDFYDIVTEARDYRIAVSPAGNYHPPRLVLVPYDTATRCSLKASWYFGAVGGRQRKMRALL